MQSPIYVDKAIKYTERIKKKEKAESKRHNFMMTDINVGTFLTASVLKLSGACMFSGDMGGMRLYPF